jgi:hypothetical protein
MAILTPEELTELRQDLARGEPEINWNKAQANAGFQAVEDWEVANASKREAAIETAIPGKFPSRLKKLIASKRLRQKHKEGKG